MLISFISNSYHTHAHTSAAPRGHKVLFSQIPSRHLFPAFLHSHRIKTTIYQDTTTTTVILITHHGVHEPDESYSAVGMGAGPSHMCVYGPISALGHIRISSGCNSGFHRPDRAYYSSRRASLDAVPQS